MPYQENSGFIRVNGSTGTGIWSAPLGTTLPADLTSAPDTAFKSGLGILEESGITMTIDKETTDIFGLAGGKLARRIRGKILASFKFGCLEQTAEILSLKFPGTMTLLGTAPDQYAKVSLVDGHTDGIERAMIFDLVDRTSSGDYFSRIVCSAVDVQADGDFQWASNKAPTASMFIASPLAGSICDLYTNSPGVLAQLS